MAGAEALITVLSLTFSIGGALLAWELHRLHSAFLLVTFVGRVPFIQIRVTLFLLYGLAAGICAAYATSECTAELHSLAPVVLLSAAATGTCFLAIGYAIGCLLNRYTGVLMTTMLWLFLLADPLGNVQIGWLRKVSAVLPLVAHFVPLGWELGLAIKSDFALLLIGYSLAIFALASVAIWWRISTTDLPYNAPVGDH